MQNLSVRHRLHNQLNVQLTDSNIIEERFNNKFTQRIIYQPNEQQSCDISLIDDLKMLDQFQQINSPLQSSQIITQSIINDDTKSYRKQFNDNDVSQIIMNKKINSPKHIRHKINSLYDKDSKYHINNQLQQSDIKISHIFKPTLLKQTLSRQQKNKNIQSIKSTTKFKILNIDKEQSQSHIADIQQKLCILPLQIQQKIKRNLNKKSIEEKQQTLRDKRNLINNSEESFVNNHFQDSYGNKIDSQLIANEAVSFILPLKDQEQQNNIRKRSKFISVNRQTSNQKLSNSSKKSLILRENRYEFKTNKQLRLNGQSSKRRTQKSFSRQKYLLVNSVSPSNQHQSPLRINDNSIQKYQQNSSIFNKNTTNQLIQRRRQQFAQYFKQKQTINNNQIIKKQEQITKNVNVETNKPVGEIQNSNVLRQNHIQLQEQFNKSKVIKKYIQILSTVPKCKKCSTTYGALTLTNNNSVIFSCNQCDLKNKLQRSVSFLSSSQCQNSQNFYLNSQKNASQFNHPVIGVLFDLQNKLQNQQQMKTYNSLIKQINIQIQKIDEKRKRLTCLLDEIQQLKSKVQKNPKVIFEAKNELKKFLVNNECQESKNLQSYLNISIPNILPSQYLQQLDLWCKINNKKFTQYPQIDSKLQILCPLYMKSYMKTMGQFINPLFHNFQTTSTKISVSEGLKLPVKSLGKATFVIDGPYNISSFERIQNLTLQFVNKRTFRQIASVMECLPQKVEIIQLSYNHKLNSHISAQKYPILTKVVSLRSCKKLNAQILNCKDEDDILSAFRVMTKKRQLKLQTTRSIYVRKPITNCTQQLKEMLKRLGKNICQLDLKIAAYFDEPQIYKQLMITERNKLLSFRLQSTINQIDSPTKNGVSNNELINRDNLSNNSIQKLDKKRNYQNYAKKCFSNKIRKKLTAFVILKQSYIEKQSLQNSLKESRTKQTQKRDMQKNYKSNHLLRLQVLKMLI